MSESYSPGPGVEPESPISTVFLSQRDLGLRVPINYVTAPGVSLSAACFPHFRYEDDNSGDCLSNLLAVGFRRFEVDLYWDEGRRVWSFCPVAIPTSIYNNDIPSSTTTISLSSSSLGALTADAEPTSPSASSSPTTFRSASTSSSVVGVDARQVSSVTASSSSASSTTSSLSGPLASTLGTTLPTVSVLPDAPNAPFVSIGPYTCTTTINLSVFTSQLLDYFQKTENTLDAHLVYVVLNIHAAASSQSPTQPAPAPANLPEPPNILGSEFSGNLSAYLYTPENLGSDRVNLNSSWYTVAERYRPVEGYYSTETNAYGVLSTEDGWPSESYIEFSKSRRLLLSYGAVDPQMAQYNFSGDTGTIFPNGYIQDIQSDIAASANGTITNGCFLRNNTDDLSQVNSSWAVDATLSRFDYPTTPTSDLIPLLNLTSSTTNCGISPILNVTLQNYTAHNSYIPYQNYSYSTIWSWAPNEPKNYSSSDPDASSDSLFRCATANIDLGGHWVVADCSSKFYAACRATKQPYNWTITTYVVSYSFADAACPDDHDFAVPRTALENSYLRQAMRESDRDYDGHGAWVDFNSLDVKGCWTVGGPNATCPYSNTPDQNDELMKRVILVPTVAAIIVLVISALTLFVKCAGNRKVRKRTRKRADNGFIYEGVPS